MQDLDLTSAGCPYCGEVIELLLDTSGGSQHYIEDCPVCCCPIEVRLRAGGTGPPAVELRRDDET